MRGISFFSLLPWGFILRVLDRVSGPIHPGLAWLLAAIVAALLRPRVPEIPSSRQATKTCHAHPFSSFFFRGVLWCGLEVGGGGRWWEVVGGGGFVGVLSPVVSVVGAFGLFFFASCFAR